MKTMNFLAHLHLAYLADSSPLGNLFADFVKGDPYKQYSVSISDGVMLHRRVDKLTDTLPAVKEARRLFSPAHQRVAPITLDVVWDHFLASHWSQFESEMSLAQFNLWAESQIQPYIHDTPDDFQSLNHYLWQDSWLENYANIQFIGKVLNGMARRRPKLAQLATSIDDVVANYDSLAQIFQNFYPEMMNKAKQQTL